jgi:hypothetical protein
MQKKVKMLVDGEDKKESQNPVANSLNKSTNKKVVNHHYKFYNIKNKKCEQKKKKHVRRNSLSMLLKRSHCKI